MIPRGNRLGTKGFSLMRQSRTLASEGLSVRYVIDSSLPPKKPRVAVVVSVKIAKTAVLRNRLRRLVRESVRKHLPKLKDGLALAFFVKAGAREYTSQQFSEEVSLLLSKTGYLAS